MAGKPQRFKRTRRRRLKPETVISLLNLPKIVSVVDDKRTESIVYPDPPHNLNKTARAEWRRMIRKLHALNRFEELDGQALAFYCETYAEWVKAGVELQKPGKALFMKSKEGNGMYRNPWGDELKRTRKEMSVYLALFGLSPHDRARIGMAKPGAPRKEPNEFDEF